MPNQIRYFSNKSLSEKRAIMDKEGDILNNENIPDTLKPSDPYIYRHLGNSAVNTQRMLDYLKCESLDQLMDEVVPEQIKLTQDSRFKHEGSELKGIDSEKLMLARMRQFMESNVQNKSYIGQGYYGTNTPSVIRRNVLENPKWYTPYTPYQPEIAQGRLESLLNFQTAIMELTGMDVANASLLDESTSAAEAVQMSYNIHNGKRTKYFVSESIFP